ncbi:Gibberellin-regulated protein 13 [Platanthera guangdongensis]|uniref:Gibberellin-regulated protein 13 n=1 Tax=Platanthera guangdongensis TaxID=2320717 RepID=A0ABR2LK96_9ASPA
MATAVKFLLLLSVACLAILMAESSSAANYGQGSLRRYRYHGNKGVCPCYNNWKTKRGSPKCP